MSRKKFKKLSNNVIFITTRFIRPAKKGDTLSIVAECLKVGKTMAFVNVEILNKSDDNKVIAQGRHTITMLTTDDVNK